MSRAIDFATNTGFNYQRRAASGEQAEALMKTFMERQYELARPFRSVASEWGKAISGFEKDLKAPIFLKNGDVTALASAYDALQQKFVSEIKRMDAARDDFADLVKLVDERDAAKAVLQKRLSDIVGDANAPLHRYPDPADLIAIWETWFKAVADRQKEEKAVFDQWTKLNANIETVIAAAFAKAKKDRGSQDISATNDQLNALEKRMRDMVAAYSNTATSINRQDIASAVKKILAVFGKA
jgi:hypothetical protein